MTCYMSEWVPTISQICNLFFYCLLFASHFFYYIYGSFNLQVRIAMVGKYTGLSDSYLSVIKVNLDALNP